MILLPDQEETLASAHSGEYMWYGGRENLIDNKVYHTMDLSGYSTAELSFWTQWDIETAWDFGFVQVSTDGGATWIGVATNFSTATNPNGQNFGFGITGSSGGWATLTADLMQELKRNDVDVIMLDEAPILLKYQILRYGKFICIRDMQARIKFQVDMLNQYEDFKQLNRVHGEASRRRWSKLVDTEKG